MIMAAAGLSQSELATRAGVARTMVSAYERDRRQATLPTLMRLLKAAGFELHLDLVPYDDHDDVLQSLERHRPSEERDAWEGYQATRVAKDRAAVSATLRARTGQNQRVPVRWPAGDDWARRDTSWLARACSADDNPS